MANADPFMNDFSQHDHATLSEIREDIVLRQDELLALVAQHQCWLLLPQDTATAVELIMLELELGRQYYRLDYLQQLLAWRRQQQRLL